MVTLPQVRGTVLRGVLRHVHVKETVPGGVPVYMTYLSSKDHEEYFSKNILHTQWYPYAALVVLLQAYYQHIARYRDQKIIELGIFAAHRDLTATLKAYSLITSPFAVGARSRLIGSQKYSVGQMVMARKWDAGFDLELRGFPEIHRLNCLMVTGYIEGFGKNWRSTYHTTHDRCVHRGDPVCNFRSVW
ncbi:MAG: hypothetical protein NZ742_04270 [Acidobacteria bacterium]|nr:hypothetical protein [Acidobacteriota bacterium]MDW7983384.1 hypothetical protein [Acidobacteriota bacterium]